MELLARDRGDLDSALERSLAAAADETRVLAARGAPLARALPTACEYGPWRPVAVLGTGGGAIVYLARHRATAALAALKVPRAARPREGRPSQLEREIRLLQSARGAGVVRVLDSEPAAERGGPWCALEYVRGLPLDRYAARERLSAGDRARLVARVADAVARLHARGFLHCDLKPGNVLVRPDGRPILIDLDVGRALGEAAAVGSAGTPPYMSPEQLARGARPVGPASDVYALGVVAFELLAGVRPRAAAGSDLAALYAASAEPLEPLRRHAPWIAPALERAILRALEPDPTARPPSARAFAQALRRAVSSGTAGRRASITAAIPEKTSAAPATVLARTVSPAKAAPSARATRGVTKGMIDNL